jgi:hypothetical protein
VDNGVKAAKRIRLFCDASGACNGGDIADDNPGSAKRVLRILRARGIAGVQYDVMALLRKQPAGRPLAPAPRRSPLRKCVT